MAKKTPTRDELTEFLLFAPFHRWLDLRVGEITEEGLEIIMPWRSEIVSNPEPKPVVHGGILASLIDLAGLYALLSQGVKTNSTAYVHVDYHRPATDGPISAKANILKLQYWLLRCTMMSNTCLVYSKQAPQGI